MCCPGCKKEHLITLSVCPSCGTMVGDSVREELAEKLIVISTPKITSKRRNTLDVQKPSIQIKLNPPPSPIITEQEIKSATGEIAAKETNRTLVEFQSKDGTVPEWRTQLKNAVRQRQLQKSPEHVGTTASSGAAAAMALDPTQTEDEFFDSADIIEETKTRPPENELLSSALNRIKNSREKYHIQGTVTATAVQKATDWGTSRPVASPAKANEVQKKTEKASVNFPAKPVYSPNVNLFDTSELDPEFVPAKVSSSFGKVTVRATAAFDSEEITDEPDAEIKPGTKLEKLPETEIEDEKAVVYEDDRAGFAYRFNAGLFDLLTASFASMILLAPFMLLGGNWFTVSGLFAFLATCSIVNFIYLSTTIGLFGKSFGMHLFGLEMIDAQGDEYPTLHQAAVSSSVFILSMAFAGAGFLTCLFDEDGRAIHDIVSNTLVVREI